MRIVFRNTKLNFTKHWGADESASIIWYFRAVGHNVLDFVWKVIGLGISISSQEENKGHYSNLDDFQEVYEDSMLIHHGKWWPSFCMDLFRQMKLRNMFGRWEISFNTAAPCSALVLRSLEWRCLGTSSIATIYRGQVGTFL